MVRSNKILIATVITVFSLSACSLLPGNSDRKERFNYYSQKSVNECTYNVQSCGYEGPYEKGERQFALEEARRLNMASLERLRRNSIDLD